ncbi:MAG: xanthine dehydrogenase family protein subunit M [Chloroflexi bacterium]|nr:xanthine dehydrogenase family protein subunit M [Chloroflexota bacterium]
MVRFEYLEPTSLGEAVSLVDRHWGQVRVMAGGTDLLVRLKQRVIRPQYVLNLKRVPGLDGLTYAKGQGLRIGALTTIRTIETSPVVKEHYPVLAEAAGMLGSVQVRNLATVGGNLCNASPSAEMPPGLLAYGAQARIVGPKGERTVPLDQFFLGPGQTCLLQGDLLAEVLVPESAPKTAGVYIKLSPRAAMDCAVVGVAAVVTLEDGKCKDCRIALGAVAPTPLRPRSAEDLLRGKPLDPGLRERAGQAAMEEAKPITDVRGSAEYRKEMVKVLTRRAVQQAFQRAMAS